MGRLLPKAPPVTARLLLLTLLAGPALAAAAPDLSVSVDRTRLNVGDRLSLTVTLVSDGGGFGGPKLTEPPLDDFAVVGRMSFSSFDSRRRQNEHKLQLQLQTLRPGTFTIGAFRYDAPTGAVTSEPLTVTVEAPAGGGAGAAGTGVAGAGATGGAPDAETAPDEYAFLRWELVPGSALWLGQGLRAQLHLYVNRQVGARLEAISDVNPQGFWSQERGNRERTRLVQIGDVVFAREVLWDQHLFPIRAGKLELPAVEATLVLSSRGLGRRSQRVTRRVAAAALDVKRLPAQGRPADFAGPAVGTVRLEASPNRTKVDAAEGFQLTVTTRVDGLIQNVPELELPPTEGLKIFPPSSSTNTSLRGDEVQGVRRQMWLIRPTRTGRLQVPALSLPYFDPSTGTYQVARSRPIWITVSGVPSVTEAAPAEAAEPSAAGPSLRTIRKAPDLTATPPGPVYRSPLLWAAGGLPPLGLLAWVLSGRLRRRRDATAGGRAARQAPRRAHQALTEAGKADPRTAYGAIAHALEGYLEARFGRSFKGLTHASLAADLGRLGVGDDTCQAWIRELENCDFARFAPGSGTDDVSAAATRARALVDAVEAEVSR